MITGSAWMSMKQTTNPEKFVEVKDSEEYKRSGRDLEDFEARLDTAQDMIFLGVDPDAPF